MSSFSFRLSILFIFLCILGHSLAAVLAIDYGTEWTKAALVKPGIPLQIVLTKDSKRKEQSVVSFKGQERLYGVDASNLVFLVHGGVVNVAGGAISWSYFPFFEEINRANGGFRWGGDIFGGTSLYTIDFIKSI